MAQCVDISQEFNESDMWGDDSESPASEVSGAFENVQSGQFVSQPVSFLNGNAKGYFGGNLRASLSASPSSLIAAVEEADR